MAAVVQPRVEKTLGHRYEEMKKTREEREMEKLRRKAQKIKEKSSENLKMSNIRSARCYEEVDVYKKYATTK